MVGGFSETLEALRELRLLENIPLSVFPVVDDFMEALSGLVLGLAPFFRKDGVKTSFILAAGETSLDLPPPVSAERNCDSPCDASNVAACRDARFVSRDVLLAATGKVVDLNCGRDGVSSMPSNRGAVVESPSAACVAVVLIKGDDDVMYPICESRLTSEGGEANWLWFTRISVSDGCAKRVS